MVVYKMGWWKKILFGIGLIIFRRTHHHHEQPQIPLIGRLLCLNLLFPLLITAYPSGAFGDASPEYSLASYPFIALIAALALTKVLGLNKFSLRQKVIATNALLVLVLLPGILGISLNHPFGQHQYNALVGGTAGAADRQLIQLSEGNILRPLLPWLNNQSIKQGQKVFLHGISPQVYGLYLRDQLLLPKIFYVDTYEQGLARSSVAAILHAGQMASYEYWTWKYLHTVDPIRVDQLGGVPMFSVYKKFR